VSAVIVSLRVSATPEDCFDTFTEDIGLWWQPHGLFEITPRGDGTLAFENRERLVTCLPSGKVFEIGRVTVWERPTRLAFTWRQATFAPDQVTSVEVNFEPAGIDTKVTVTHRGWDSVPQDSAARHGLPLASTQMRLAELWRAGLAALSDRFR
jgi:uncharacterized protein YndB with AHSA1/START domain